MNQEELIHELSHTSMLQFCQCLYEDVSQNINEWASFVDYEDLDIDKRKAELDQKLECLKNLIAERTEWFGEHRCFL
ncbi:MAG: hypothetical protein ACLSA6_08445 [Holdemania massiliensis]